MTNPDIATLREILYDAGTLCSRLSSAVSNGELPPELGSEVAATRGCVIAAQLCCHILVEHVEYLDREHRARARNECGAGRQ